MAPLEDSVTQTSQPDPPITPDIFQHLVRLAARAPDDEEAEYLSGQLNKQLRAIRDLASVDLPEGLPITSHGVPYPSETRPDLRRDEVKPSDKADAILEQVPEVEERFIVVPDISSTELE